MKKFILLFLFTTTVSMAQNINDYKYVLVPEKFSFLKESNKYNLNVLSKLLLQKYNFEAYIEKETAPDDFLNTNCNKLFFDLLEDSSMFSTKLKIVLKDCKGTVLFTSEEGISKDKSYYVAYNLSLRMAFENFNVLKLHKYESTQKNKGIIGEPSKNNVATEISRVSETAIPRTVVTHKIISGQHYAQPIENGFQIIDSEPKVIYKIYKTSTKDFYTASKGTLNGVFFLRNNEWFFEYYEQEKLVTEMVSVKF